MAYRGLELDGFISAQFLLALRALKAGGGKWNKWLCSQIKEMSQKRKIRFLQQSCCLGYVKNARKFCHGEHPARDWSLRFFYWQQKRRGHKISLWRVQQSQSYFCSRKPQAVNKRGSPFVLTLSLRFVPDSCGFNEIWIGATEWKHPACVCVWRNNTYDKLSLWSTSGQGWL